MNYASALRRQIALGELIAALELREQDQEVRFDFCYTAPDGIASYRGYYDHLAIGWKDGKTVTVADFLSELRAVPGTVMEGYKGGDYRMTRNTPLWVANYSESGSTAVVGLADCEWATVIATEYHG